MDVDGIRVTGKKQTTQAKVRSKAKWIHKNPLHCWNQVFLDAHSENVKPQELLMKCVDFVLGV